MGKKKKKTLIFSNNPDTYVYGSSTTGNTFYFNTDQSYLQTTDDCIKDIFVYTRMVRLAKHAWLCLYS